MSIHTDILKTFGMQDHGRYVDLGWHGNPWDANGASYRWDAERQVVEVKMDGEWRKSKWTTHTLTHLQDGVEFDLDDWDEDDGPYQKWSVYVAVRDAGIILT